MRVLLVKPSSFGDVVHAMPVARALIAAGHEVDWLVNSQYAALVRQVCGLRRVVPLARRRWARPRFWPELLRARRALGRGGYDLAIDLQGLLRSGWLARGARPARVIGLSDAREGSRWLYDRVVALPVPRAHAVERYLSVLPALGVPVPAPPLDYGLSPSPRAIEAAWAWASAPDRPAAGGRAWVGLQLGSRWRTKLWPPAAWEDFIASVLAGDSAGTRFVISGSGEEEARLAARLADRWPDRVFNRVGRVPLSGLAPLFRGLSAFVSGDTGPMHLAVACGVPVCALFGPTRPEWTGPHGAGHRVLQARELPCVPCLSRRCRVDPPHACMQAISGASAAAAVRPWLAGCGRVRGV